MKKFIFRVLSIVVLFAIFSSPTLAKILLERDDLLNVEHEPILRANKVIYVRNSHLYFKQFNSNPTALSDKAFIRSFDFAINDKIVVVAWSRRDKASNQDTFVFRTSLDSGNTWEKPVKVTVGSLLSNVRVKADRTNKSFVLSVQDNDQKFIFVCILNEKGKLINKYKIQAVDIRAIFFHDVCPSGKEVKLFVHVQKKQSTGTQILEYSISTTYPPGSPRVILANVPSAGFLKCGRYDNKVFFLVKYAVDRHSRLSIFITNPQNTYKEMILSDSEDVARADFAILNPNKILVLYSSEVPKKIKQRVYAVTIDGKQLRILNKLRLDNTYPNTTAWLPVVTKSDDGKVLVAWEDTRNIRSNIYIAYSPDLGKSWTYNNVGLSPKNRFAFRPKLSFFHGSFFVVWMEWTDDTRTRADLALAQLPVHKINMILTKLSQNKVFYTRSEKEQNLERRVKEYWNALRKKDYHQSYTFLDPFYRAVVPYEAYAAPMGHIEYEDWKIQEIKVVGNEGIIKAVVKYKVKNLPISGRIYSSNLRTGKIEDVWIFVDGQWFKKFVDYLSGGTSVKY